MNHKSIIGKQGEDVAAEYLGSKGYEILFRNKSWKWGELDIVAKAPDKTLVFVEVKTMSQSKSANTVQDLKPEDNLTSAKLRKLQRTAQLFAGHHPELINDEMGWRIDLLAICLTDNSHTVKHYENI